MVAVSEFKELIFLLPCPWIMAVRSRASTSVIALLQNNNGTSWAPRIEVAPVCIEGSYFCCLAYGGLVSRLFSALCLLVVLSISDMQMTLCDAAGGFWIHSFSCSCVESDQLILAGWGRQAHFPVHRAARPGQVLKGNAVAQSCCTPDIKVVCKTIAGVNMYIYIYMVQPTSYPCCSGRR